MILKAGSVVDVNLEPVIGNEKNNHGKSRMCIVVSYYEKLQLAAVLPITDEISTFGNLFVPISDLKKAGCTKPSKIDCVQIRTISTKRINPNIAGIVGKTEMFKIKKNLALLFGIEDVHLT